MAKFMTIAPVAFYCPQVHAGMIPADAVELTEAEYVNILAGTQGGKDVLLSAEGRPELGDRDPAVALAQWRERSRISRYQLRAVLLARDMLAVVGQVINDTATPEIRLAWADAADFGRIGPVVAFVQSILGVDDIEVDALFAEASRVAA